MNVVFDDALAAPPATAANESTSRTRFISGSRPCSSRNLCLIAQPDRRTHRVEEVGEHDGDHRGDRRHDTHRREEPERELSDEAEVGRGRDGIRHLRDPGAERVQIAL